jgi:hypothetical protein
VIWTRLDKQSATSSKLLDYQFGFRSEQLFYLGFDLIEQPQVRGCAARLAPKQSPHKTGLPVEGLNGTVSVLPH